jgi:hypothetical protein
MAEAIHHLSEQDAPIVTHPDMEEVVDLVEGTPLIIEQIDPGSGAILKTMKGCLTGWWHKGVHYPPVVKVEYRVLLTIPEREESGALYTPQATGVLSSIVGLSDESFKLCDTKKREYRLRVPSNDTKAEVATSRTAEVQSDAELAAHLAWFKKQASILNEELDGSE